MNKNYQKMGSLLGICLGLPLIVVNSMAFGSATAFPDTSLNGWKERSFVGNTQYELLSENGTNVLKATASSTASVLYKKSAIDLTKTPWLDWSWKIDSIYQNISEQTKAGDDFPVRLYVIAKTGFLPWETIAINYVWSSNQPVDANWTNPHTSNAMMVVVQSGEQKAGQWVNQRRNIAEDFQRFFDTDVEQLAGYAVMVDGDNSLQSGTAYFGNIEFSIN